MNFEQRTRLARLVTDVNAAITHIAADNGVEPALLRRHFVQATLFVGEPWGWPEVDVPLPVVQTPDPVLDRVPSHAYANHAAIVATGYPPPSLMCDNVVVPPPPHMMVGQQQAGVNAIAHLQQHRVAFANLDDDGNDADEQGSGGGDDDDDDDITVRTTNRDDHPQKLTFCSPFERVIALAEQPKLQFNTMHSMVIRHVEAPGEGYADRPEGSGSNSPPLVVVWAEAAAVGTPPNGIDASLVRGAQKIGTMDAQVEMPCLVQHPSSPGVWWRAVVERRQVVSHEMKVCVRLIDWGILIEDLDLGSLRVLPASLDGPARVYRLCASADRLAPTHLGWLTDVGAAVGVRVQQWRRTAVESMSAHYASFCCRVYRVDYVQRLGTPNPPPPSLMATTRPRPLLDAP